MTKSYKDKTFYEIRLIVDEDNVKSFEKEIEFGDLGIARIIFNKLSKVIKIEKMDINKSKIRKHKSKISYSLDNIDCGYTSVTSKKIYSFLKNKKVI